MTGSPFSNVLGKDQDSSSFKNVESNQVGDTTDPNADRPADDDSDPAPPVVPDPGSPTGQREAEQNETQGQTDRA